MIKQFIDSKENDIFSLFRGLDLQELLFQIENYYLVYRNSLNLPEYVGFGVEIEYEDVRKSIIDSYIEYNLCKWDSKDDGSLKNGGEITSPVMIDSLEYWNELKIVCDYLSKKRANMSCNAGGHIHIGYNVLGNDVEAWKIFLKLYMCYENVLSRFFYGDKINGRKNLLKYARPTADIIYDLLPTINNANHMIDFNDLFYYYTRYLALNLTNIRYDYPYETYKNTIEFRNPNATPEAIVIQNNINAVSKLCVVARNKVID